MSTARAYQQPQPPAPEKGEWGSLRAELANLLKQIDSQVAAQGGAAGPTQPAASQPSSAPKPPARPEGERQREALRSVQRAITRFGERDETLPMPPNPRDSLQAAIDQIRSKQAPVRVPEAAPVAVAVVAPPAPVAGPDPALFESLANSVNGLTGRLETLEGEIKAQIKTGGNIKDVADQVAQLSKVVELLSGAVGETGQVKRLEDQIAGLSKLMTDGRKMDIDVLTRRLDDVAATVGRLAELQVHYADRVESPVDTAAFKDGMLGIEDNLRKVYDRIDSIEEQRSLHADDLEHVTAEMARFTAALRDNSEQPQHLVQLVDALNSRISEIESGDRVLHALQQDLAALKTAVLDGLAPRFDALDSRIEALSSNVGGTRDEIAAIGEKLDTLGERMEERSSTPAGFGQLEAQVRQLVARMDQTGEQLSNLARLYQQEPASPDIDAMAELVASRTAEAVQTTGNDAALHETLTGLETRITGLISAMPAEPVVPELGDMQAGINEVNARLKRLEESLAMRIATPQPLAPQAPVETVAEVPVEDVASPAIDAEARPLAPRRDRDSMPANPAMDRPLSGTPFPPPTPVLDLSDAELGLRPSLHEDELPVSFADEAPADDIAVDGPPTGFDPASVALPPAPRPGAGFFDDDAVEADAPTESSRNTFIEAARRAAQRQGQGRPSLTANSLVGKALSRFQAEVEGDKVDDAVETKPAKAAKVKQKPVKEPKLAAPTPTAERKDVPQLNALKANGKGESFLLRNRKAVLLGASVVALACLTANLVAQRMNAEAPVAPAVIDTAPAVPAPETPAVTTGEAATKPTADVTVPSAEPAVTVAAAPRVIPMVDSTQTGSIDKAAPLGFAPTAATADMPSAFSAAADTASALPSTDAVTTTAELPTDPALPANSPVKVELPPEGLGPVELRQAAADGDVRAQFEIAAIYTEGRAVPQDYKAAATWYERSAAQGFAPAQYRLGSLYENGNGVTKDFAAARLWYERAAEAGNRMSMHNLAALYASGQLGQQDFAAAAKWFEEAASRGLTDSQFNLGMLYARGLGVTQSLPDSYKWFALAAMTGDKDAAKARDDIAKSLDAATLSSLQIQVNSFKAASIDLKANFAPIGTWSKTFDPGETITSKDIVSSVQKALVKLGYDVGNPDGIAGPKTAIAIRSFEDATGMSETGAINPRLLAVLGSQPV